jgi:hypothetical protein
MITFYDPEVDPDAEQWLELSEEERFELVERYHRDARIKLPQGMKGPHAVVHTIVETRLAMDETVDRQTLRRLMKDGLSRHDAVHAIACVIAEHMYDIIKGARKAASHSAEDLENDLRASLEQLTVDEWRARGRP